ncbi:MAG: response regulator [Halanaerobiaceae bacterium]
MGKKILVIDDEENIRELIQFNLQEDGYDVLLAEDGKKGLDMLSENVDLVVLDLMLPGIDGLEVCRKIRNDSKYKNVPIIMLTAKGEEVDKVVGLELGADDYMVKPFSPRELLARIKALFRRIDIGSEELTENSKQQKVIKNGSLEVNLNSHEVRLKGEVVELTPKEFALVKYLIINKNNVLSREVLLDKIWGYSYAGDTRTVDVHIRRLRKKIGEEFIQTVRGVGYKFVEME